MEELVAKIFVLSAAVLIVFAIMFGLTAKIQVDTKAMPATVSQTKQI